MKRFIPSITWTLALIALFFTDASSTTSLCLLKFAGIDWCWGCGIGHSMHHTLHFEFAEAVKHHWLGIPSSIALIWLIIRPLINKHTQHEPSTTDTNDAGYSAR
jgi:hypothetical protein